MFIYKLPEIRWSFLASESVFSIKIIDCKE